MLTPNNEAGQHGIARSDKWPAVERAHLEKHPQCVACVSPGAVVAVHHVMPFHICIALGRPDLELDERNLITLCAGGEGEHHLLLGHSDDWDSMNLSVRHDARGVFHGKSAKEIPAAWLRIFAAQFNCSARRTSTLT
jgi:5-methylcytosine-specific restriction enzyme A